jgi:hypothetical protein
MIDRNGNRSKNRIGESQRKPSVLLLSTSLLVDRVYQYTRLIDELSENFEVDVWASSYGDPDSANSWAGVRAEVKEFPEVRAFREFPHNFLRRLNEFVWDYRYLPPSRMSMLQHVRDSQMSSVIKALKPPAWCLAMLRSEKVLEAGLERLLLSYPRSSEAFNRLQQDRPCAILTTGPFQFEQPAIFAAAHRLGIPMLAYIPSWDNVSTKNRMVFKYDGYIVWNEHTKAELRKYYPHTRNNPVYVVGAPQFDVFFQPRFECSREEFCEGQKLDPSLPIIVYAIGSPNFLKEHHGAVYLAERVFAGHLGDVQLLVRPHPIHDNAELKHIFDTFHPKVRLQQAPNAGKKLTSRTQDELQMKEWVNTFRHADVVVNLSSTVTIDAAIYDKPVVNLDFDPQPSREDQQLIKDVNHKWDHFKPIAESGGVWLVNSFEELEKAVMDYLSEPNLHQEKRRWIAEFVCGYLDGNCGERMAAAISDFAVAQRQDVQK